MTHTLRLTVEHPYADLIAGFIGPGSVDDGAEYISLAPDATQVITLAIHAQDAEQVNYDLTAQVIADEDSPGNEIVDYAHLSVRVLRANNFTTTLVSEDPDTLVKTYQVKNLGLPITDLSVQALDPASGLPAQALIQPALHHARLGKAGDPDDTLTFQVIPLFSPDDAIALQALSRMGAGGGLASPLPQRTDFDIKVVATVLDTVQELVGNYACLGDNQLYAVTLHNVWASYFNHDWYCTNRPSIDLDFPVPGNINVSDILSATVSTSLSPRSTGVRPHDVRILFNGNQVGELLDQVPDGSYTFSVDPAFFNPSANPVQPVNQTLGLRTYHFNGGHYVVNTSSRLDLPLANYTRYVCAADDQEARDKAGQGFWPIPTHIDIQIVQPQAGAQLELGWPVVLEATVDDGHESYIYYPVLARIVYSDPPEDVKTVMLVPYSSSGTVDTYRGYWLPARAGEVSITQTVYAGIVSGSDNVVVTVEPQATFSISGQVTWTASGNPIGGVTVEAQQGGLTIGSDTTDGADGTYQVSNLPAGTYQLTASREGYTFVSAADGSDTIQVQITNADVPNQNFVVKPPSTPSPPVTGFKGANWLRFFDANDPDTFYINHNVGWNLELAGEHDIAVDGIDTIRRQQNVYTIIRLETPPPNEDYFRDASGNVDLSCSGNYMQTWMGLLDNEYEEVSEHPSIATDPRPVQIFIFGNEPNHSNDEWNYSGSQYAHAYNCYYQRWRGFEAGHESREEALYVAGPGQDGPCDENGANCGTFRTFYDDLLVDGTETIIFADGFAIHVYGYYAADPNGDDEFGFLGFLDKALDTINTRTDTGLDEKPVIVTEYNPGVQTDQPIPYPINEPIQGWQDWFNRTYCWVYRHNEQIQGLLFFVDEINQDRELPIETARDRQWVNIALRGDDDRRDRWLEAGTPNQQGNFYDPNNNCALQQGHIPLESQILYASVGDIFVLPEPTNQQAQTQSRQANLSIAGIVSGTLGRGGFKDVYYVTDNLEVPAGQTLTIIPGTSLVFSSGLKMDVAGQLIAEGNRTYPIRFLSTDATGWNGLHMLSSSVDSRCLGCYLENLATGSTALQIDAPITFQDSFIQNVPDGVAIASSTSFNLSNVLLDYVGTGLYLSGSPSATYNVSHLTLSRCEQGIVNQGQTAILDNSIIVACSEAISTTSFGTTTVNYTLLHNNLQNFATEAGSQLNQGFGLLIDQEPLFVNASSNFKLQPDSPAVNSADPAADYSREPGYNGGRADMGAYGNTRMAPEQPPLAQMAVSINTDTPGQSGQPGQTIAYSLTLRNEGTVPDTYRITVDSNPVDFRPTLYEAGYDAPLRILDLAPQGQIIVTVWVQIPVTANSGQSATVSVLAANRYGVADSVELTASVALFQENNGQVVMEAEHYADQIDRSGHTWLTQDSLADFTGSGYVIAWPDIDRQFGIEYATTSSEVNYVINFSTPGTYYVWGRGYAPNGAGDSLYMRLDDQPATALTGFAPRGWDWANSDTQGSPVTIEASQPGIHILHIWQREDGLRLDRILLTTDSNYTPSEGGPPESNLQ